MSVLGLMATMLSMRVGSRVRAPLSIDYGRSAPVIAEGTTGTVTQVRNGGALALVQWDGVLIDSPHWTSFSSLEVLPS